MKTISAMLFFLSLTLCSFQSNATLSIPPLSPTYNASPRAIDIQEVANQIANEPRNAIINGEEYPFYVGPIGLPGSLTEKLQVEELTYIYQFNTSSPERLVALVQKVAATLTSFDGYIEFYEKASNILPTPMTIDNSDANFGAQRLTVRGFNLKLIEEGQDDVLSVDENAPELSDTNVEAVCGNTTTWGDLKTNHQLFVTNFSEIDQFNDPNARDRKFVSSVIGYFCFNQESNQLLPLAIYLLETNLIYTPMDTPEEWTLAKMALNAAENNYQQFQHLAETHAVTSPIRVEAYRHMAAEHPVRALLLHHAHTEFAIEKLAMVVLLNSSTVPDETFGFGATGAMRFLMYQLDHNVGALSFPDDIASRGLHYIPTHKYAKFGALYYAAIQNFVSAYLGVYYPSQSAIVNDIELQNWANACRANIPHIQKLFPECIQSVETLANLLTHLIFQSTVKHHAMNGAVSWETVNLPFSAPALWNDLPLAKLQSGQTLDLMSYVQPLDLFPKLVALAAGFYRRLPLSQMLVDAYKNSPFSDEKQLTDIIHNFELELEAIDDEITNTEKGEEWRYYALRPSNLPYNSWI